MSAVYDSGLLRNLSAFGVSQAHGYPEGKEEYLWMLLLRFISSFCIQYSCALKRAAPMPEGGTPLGGAVKISGLPF
jgi:hypothetical protein